MIRVVADTNVLASGLAGYDALEGPAAYLLRAWQQRRFDLVASGPIFEELEGTLAKPYFAQRLGPPGGRYVGGYVGVSSDTTTEPVRPS